MKKAVPTLVLVVAAAGGGYAFYRHGLSDQDRETVSRAVGSARSLFHELGARLGPMVEQMGKGAEAVDTSNRDATRRQWSELGF